jgi:hypothetical protein
MLRFVSVSIAVAMALVWTGEAAAVAFCAKRNAETGLPREGATLKLRATCRLNEVALPISIEEGGQTVRLTGVNLQVVSGSGATAAPPNGLGNVIIGYNEDDLPMGDLHTGSHNLVVGADHSFTASGGLLAGYGNTVSADFASVTGGTANLASGAMSWVGGGEFGEASGSLSAVAGGYNGRASGVGGATLGGFGARAEGDYSVVAGGEGGRATGLDATVTGGSFCVASGAAATVSGGNHVTQATSYGWAAGSAGTLQTGRFTSP